MSHCLIHVPPIKTLWGKNEEHVYEYATKTPLNPVGKNKDKIGMAYVDYCLIVNSYGKNLGRKTDVHVIL